MTYKKYKNYTVNGQTFTVKLKRHNNSIIGWIIDFEVYEYHEPAKNIFKRFYQWCTVKFLTYGTYCARVCSDTLDATIIHSIEIFLYDQNLKEQFEKEWENL